MNSRFLKSIAVAGAIALLAACGGGGGGGSSDNTDDTQTPATQSVSSVTVTDASKAPISGATVQLSSALSSKPAIAKMNSKSGAPLGEFTTDASGNFTIPAGLAPGSYSIKVTINGVEATMTFTVGANNSISNVKILTPLSNDGTTWSSLEGVAVIASVSGGVYDTSANPISGATVSLSGGTATNGAVATGVTDANGRYDLLINTSITKESALLNSTLTVSAPGFQTHQLTGYQVVKNTVTTGLNFMLSAGTASNALWQENFETASANDWVYASTDTNVKWNLHATGANITNQALTDGRVNLAPDDASLGKVPNPAEGSKAFWYGDATKGNFLGASTYSNNLLDGGTSDSPNSGTLTSPTIDLTNVAATQPVSLTFKNWWEIEAGEGR